MVDFSFEMVPRSEAAVVEQYDFIQKLGATISLINVPDIQRLSMRSWQVSPCVDCQRYRFLPHFRAIDFKISGTELFKIIENHQLQQILLVSGDPPEGLQREFYDTDVVDLIRVVKRQFPALKIYAGFDPHRQSFHDELHYIQRKVDAGADGFFSQPFFDERLIEVYIESMRHFETFIGLSPITSEASKNYWEVKNKVKFPANFHTDYQWNADFANRVIADAKTEGFNIYFMPIKIDLHRYFSQLDIVRPHLNQIVSQSL